MVTYGCRCGQVMRVIQTPVCWEARCTDQACGWVQAFRLASKRKKKARR